MWVKLQVVVGETTEVQMINMDNYKGLKKDPDNAEQIVLTHNDDTTLKAAATFELAQQYFMPLLYKEDLLGNPL